MLSWLLYHAAPLCLLGLHAAARQTRAVLCVSGHATPPGRHLPCGQAGGLLLLLLGGWRWVCGAAAALAWARLNG